MKKTVRNYLSMLVLGSMSQITLAAGFSPPGLQIVGMDVGDTSALIVRLSGNTECGTPYAVVGNTQPFYKDMLATASLAYAAGKDVRVWVQSCDTNGRAVIVRMALGNVW